MARKPTDEVQLKLRFSEALRRRLERAAARNNRSMNTEIIHRLERSLTEDESASELRAFTDMLTARPGEKVKAIITGAPLEKIHEKLNKIIAVLESEKSEDDGEKK